ncbi:MAG TPA: twin-arginine translocase TatA/TatE family subunit [Thermoanaerobaculia bacterium]|nr:twin-arginine translocase TatA/TatE family subunit [Thermoanaerobaculia bacterium]
MFEGLFQPMHLLLILGIALLFFGPGKLPELGRGLGTAIRDFKKAFKEEEEKPQIAAASETRPETRPEARPETRPEDIPKGS